MSDIKLIDAKINREELKRLIDEGFKDMVKYTVDVKQRRIAIGGELHMEITNRDLREKIKEITFALIGRGEAL